MKQMKERKPDPCFSVFHQIILMFLVLFFHVACKISNFNKRTAKHLAQASCTEFTLMKCFFGFPGVTIDAETPEEIEPMAPSPPHLPDLVRTCNA